MEYSFIDLGVIEYSKAYAIQKNTVMDVKSGKTGQALIFAQHYPVFTIGRSAKADSFLIGRDTIKSRCIDIVRTDRGGDVTFHGPGQAVVYPVLDLRKHGKDLHRYLRGLESVIILTLSTYNIKSFSIKGKTGCWTEQGKIASIGISASNWISYHGLALNANTDLSYFDIINPCGMSDIKMVSMQQILGRKIDLDNLNSALKDSFQEIFID